MKHSADRILTTHTGSLPRPPDLVALLNRKEMGEAYDRAEYSARVRRAIDDIVRRQADTGIDIVDDGEHSKVNWMAYARARLSGLEEIDSPVRFRGATRDSLAFPGAYEDMKVMLAARSGEIVAKRQVRPRAYVCSAPIKYVGQEELQTDIENLKAAVKNVPVEEAFMTAISLSNLELYYENQYYGSEEEYLAALADAMHVEYKAIVDAGLLLQIDDPRMATHYNRAVNASVEECRKFIALRVEAVNHALRGIPEDRVRFHTCYSVNIAPRVHDFELKHFVDLMLTIRAGAYLIEAANPRHEHEWQVWENVKLPDGKILVPGVVSHCIHLVEHPELVAQRIVRFADVVGREQVIAGTDCGFGTSGAGDEVHPDVAWAKLQAMVDGARLASERLWGR
ncbi:MAG TPA: cobalamin-independent methionine synthase II family protein [Xanthobacteraceae bacterium]|nr:cobalamin-independent methionine synthase II family protein [Xanthobacteraceae bacterium]